MRYAVLALALGACCAPEEKTLGEAAKLIAYANCSRWIECGTSDQSWRACVNDLIWEFCTEYNCSEPYKDWFYEEVEVCTEWFSSVECSIYVEPCYL